MLKVKQIVKPVYFFMKIVNNFNCLLHLYIITGALVTR